ncbi:eukaryotic translation initiation factor 4 gamma 3-like isoform X1 [Artemia franciscana]|uniref:eukaryotic translation initiation factor 4 gamma 3-like isoform X1 n=1 Tax=Artemia franciscana TaxID=6661 RepID=UPI0032DB4049
MRNTGEQLREERDTMEDQRQEEQRQQVRLEEECTLFEEEKRIFEQEKRKLKDEAQRKCAEEKHLLEKERARKAKELEKQMEEKNLDFTRDSPGSHLYRIFKESSRDNAIAQAQQPANWNQGRKQMNQGHFDTAGADAMSPAYLRSSMQGNKTPLPQRLSQGKSMHRPTTVINIPVTQPKVAFPKVENAWVPDTFAKKKVTDWEEQKTIQPANGNQGRKQMNQGHLDTAGADAMSPAYLRPLPQRLSQGKGRHRPTTVINIPVALPFPKVENAWVPDTFAKKKVTDREEKKTIDLKKAIRGRLNKLTPENYDKISRNILEMEVNTEERLSAIIQIFFDKAVDDAIYAPICSNIYIPLYAELCKLMFEKEVLSASGTGKVSFRKLLLDRCQATFEKEKKDEEEIVSKQKVLQEADTEEKKKELQMELNERIAKTKRIMLGNIRFIGELFKLRMLTIKIMNFCILKLLKSRDEEQLEFLCKLISTIGKTYEEEYDAKYQRAVAESKSSGKQPQMQRTKLDVYLEEMKKLNQSEDLSSRIRFMLMDVLDLKQNRWVPRREREKPKTEILGELEKGRLEKALSLQEDIIKQPQMGYPSQRRYGGRGDERKKSRSAVDDRGWQISQGKKGSFIGQDQSSYSLPPRMTSQPREMKLGPTQAWSKGAGLTPTAVQTGVGRYSALLDDEGSSVSSPSATNIRLGPPRSLGRRGAAIKSMGPVPTERQKAVQATHSFTRSRSQQASRERSLSRQGAATPTTEQVPFQAKSELKGKPDLTEEEIQRKTDDIISEFLSNGDLQDS